MSDRTFTGFSFASTASGAVARTMPDRLADIYNVKDFGAVGNAPFPYDGTGTDDTAAIQAAIDAAYNSTYSGIVFFPPGRYKVTGKLKTYTTHHTWIHYQGCGADVEAGTGSILVANMQDYILYVPHAFVGLSSVDGLGFYNANSVVPTSTEPPGIVEINPDTGLPYPYTPDGAGCLYTTMGVNLLVSNCAFKINKGICVFFGVQNSWITNCVFSGTYAVGQGQLDSSGVWGINSAITNCKFKNLAIAVDYYFDGGSFFILDSLVIENCGHGMKLGKSELTYWYWSGNAGNINSSLNTNCVVAVANVNNIIMRNCSIKFVSLGNSRAMTFQNMKIVSDGSFGTPTHGFDKAGFGSKFRNITISGSFSTAAMDLFYCDPGGGPGVLRVANIFENVDITNNIGPAIVNSTPLSPMNTYMNCPNLDTGVTLANFPLDDASVTQAIATDNPDPEWTGTVSNVGKPVGRTLATNSVTAVGTTQLNFPAPLPAWMAVGLQVADVSASVIPPGTTVSSFNGPAGTLNLSKPVGRRLYIGGPTLTDRFLLGPGSKILKLDKPLPSWLAAGQVCEDKTSPSAFAPSNTRTIASVDGTKGYITLTTPIGLTLTTTASSAAGTTGLTFPSGLPSWMANGLPVFYFGPVLPELTTVASVNVGASTITFSNPARATIPTGSIIIMGMQASFTTTAPMSPGAATVAVSGNTDYLPAAVGEECVFYLNQSPIRDPVSSVSPTVASFNSPAGTVTLSVPIQGAGVGVGDIIGFGSGRTFAADEIIFYAGPGVGNGDTIAFKSGGGSNRIMTRFNGFYWQIAAG